MPRNAITAMVLVPLFACSSKPDSSHASPAPEARAAAEASTPEAGTVTEPRFLVVAIRRIQIIDRHPEDGEERVEHAPSDGRFVIPSYATRPQARRPDRHAYDVTLAIPEAEIVSFEVPLDERSQYRLWVHSRGWTVDSDGKIRWNAVEATNWSIKHSNGAGEGPNPSSWDVQPLPLDTWTGFDVMRARDRDFAYYEHHELRYGPITAQPPTDALRGAPDTAEAQKQKELNGSPLRITLP
jgi:hypothetical protein